MGHNVFWYYQDRSPSSQDLPKELLHYCTKGLETYKRPRWFEFVDALPRTATGKTQRFKLYEVLSYEC